MDQTEPIPLTPEEHTEVNIDPTLIDGTGEEMLQERGMIQYMQKPLVLTHYCNKKN